jgi:hypothetical protein
LASTTVGFLKKVPFPPEPTILQPTLHINLASHTRVLEQVAALRAYMRTEEDVDVPAAVLGWRESMSLPPSSSSLPEQVMRSR